MRILKEVLDEFLTDDCPRMAAALSYYTLFSLPALLLLVMLVAGAFADPAELRARLLEPIRILVGPAGTDQVRVILENAQRPPAGSPLTVAVGVTVLLFAATGAFAQLQATLNRAWHVEPDPRRRGIILRFLAKRVLSFFLILGVALLLLVSTVASTAVTALGDLVRTLLPGALAGAGIRALGVGLSLVVATLLFGLLFHVLPDARVYWKDAWVGAAATGFLFLLGNLLLGLYLGSSDPGSAFGAAGSLAVILVWVYYSANIFFLGAELTQVLARRRGEEIRPSPGAVRVRVKRTIIREEPT